jgi:hypothetical protein
VRQHLASVLLALAGAFAALVWWASAGASTDAPASVPAALPGASAVNDASSSPAGPAAKRAPPKVAQPIDFPHWRHAGSVAQGGMEINCLYCHSYARRSIVAGIPPLAKCMGCHKHVATEKPEIVKLTEYWKRGEPVPWKKVHDLPDFVYFSHERHVQRFVFQQGQPVQQVCGYCHGDVKTMGVAEKQKKLTMGWCLSCHKQFQEQARETPMPARDWVVPAADQPLVAKAAGKDQLHGANAPRDCLQCHK